MLKLMTQLAHPMVFTSHDVSIAYDGDGCLLGIVHALINVTIVWLICLMYIPGGMVVWVPCKHEGNYTQVKIELCFSMMAGTG